MRQLSTTLTSSIFTHIINLFPNQHLSATGARTVLSKIAAGIATQWLALENVNCRRFSPNKKSAKQAQ